MISQHYTIQEFVPPVIYQQFGDNSIWFIDQRIVLLADWLCDYFGVHLIVNDWHKGGQFKESGFRDPATSTGAARGQHKFGRAADFKHPQMDAEGVREEIRRNYKALNQRFGVTTIEQDTPTWCHVDLRWTGLDKLLEVPYK